MGSTASRITIIARRVPGLVTTAIMKQAVRAGMSVAVDEIRKRSRAGIDNRGRRMPKYTSKYLRQKARMIRGDLKMKDRRTPFAAKNVNDKMALSGRTMSDMYVKSTTANDSGGEGVIDFRSQRSRDVVEGNARRGRDIRGLAPANTAQGKREREAIGRAVAGVARKTQITLDITST